MAPTSTFLCIMCVIFMSSVSGLEVEGGPRYFILTGVGSGLVAAILCLIVGYCMRRMNQADQGDVWRTSLHFGRISGSPALPADTTNGSAGAAVQNTTMGSRGGNAQNETTNGNEGERTSKKSDSSTSSPGQAAGNGSKSGGSTPRSSSSGSDKPSTNPNYTSTALQEVEIHAYMDLHTRDPTYASTTSSKDPHTYMELKTLRAQSDPQQPGGERNGNDGYETPQMPGRGNQSSDGYETPQPPREGRRRSALYANQGISGEAIQEEVDYYNEA